MTRIKICGITNVEDAVAAEEAGADALGIVFAHSPRRVDLPRALEIRAVVSRWVKLVGVFVDAPLEAVREVADAAELDLVQLHGTESPQYCRAVPRPVIKRFDIPAEDPAQVLTRQFGEYDVPLCLLDPGAGSGKTFDWTIARGLGDRVILSGGLNPENVQAAIAAAQPPAVDVASGVEARPGRKDHRKMIEFVNAVRAADAD